MKAYRSGDNCVCEKCKAIFSLKGRIFSTDYDYTGAFCPYCHTFNEMKKMEIVNEEN